MNDPRVEAPGTRSGRDCADLFARTGVYSSEGRAAPSDLRELAGDAAEDTDGGRVGRGVRVVLLVSELSFTITKRRTVISKVFAIGGSKELVPCTVPGQGLDNVVACA